MNSQKSTIFNKNSNSDEDLSRANGAERPELDRLLAAASDPMDYYRGLTARQLLVPRNILVFSRLFPHGLNATPTRHGRYVLILQFGSETSLFLDERPMTLTTGDCILIFPFQTHYFHVDMSKSGERLLFITFELDEDADTLPGRNRLFTIGPTERELALRLLRCWSADIRLVQTSQVALTLASLLDLVLGQSLTGQDIAVQARQSSIPRELLLLTRLMHEHMNETIEELCRRAGISIHRAKYLYRRHLGTTPGRFLMTIRMNRARHDLANTALSVAEIAYACQYESIYVFSRAFKRDNGCSPREYRRRLERSDAE